MGSPSLSCPSLRHCGLYILILSLCQERPYHNDSTASRLLSEVKHCRARLVLQWGTTLESLVLFFYIFFAWSLTSINSWVLDEISSLFYSQGNTENTQQSTKLKLMWGTVFESWCCPFMFFLLISHWHPFSECGMTDHFFFLFTGKYCNYSKISTKLKLYEGPCSNPW